MNNMTAQDISEEFPIRSSDSMERIIRDFGIIPLTRSRVKGWSIEELTHPDWWFASSDELGPWDWKIDAVRQGYIYGKFISRQSTFATRQMYVHLMNWRRSLSEYKVAEGGATDATTIDRRLQKYLSPILLSAIRKRELLDSSEIRLILENSVPQEIRRKVGGHIEKYLIPKVKKQAVDFILSFLDMGTWTVVGDITRIYRGPNCEYRGWQRNSITTPEAILGFAGEYLGIQNRGIQSGTAVTPQAIPGVRRESGNTPSWARFIKDETDVPLRADCSPEESRMFIIDHLSGMFPEERAMFERII